MEQLANMPIWAQLLSMGGFMFASGVLMTRIPIAPALILSFFYLFGVFGSSLGREIPGFTFKNPCLWTALLLAFAGVFAFLWYKFLHADFSAADGMGIGFAGVFLNLATIGSVIGMIILMWIPAVSKWIKLLPAVSHAPWQMLVWIVLFVGGIAVGLLSLKGCYSDLWHSRGVPIYQVMFVTMVAIAVCVCSLFCIAWQTKISIFLEMAVLIVVGSGLLLFNGIHNTLRHSKFSEQKPLAGSSVIHDGKTE
ncbi:MAG: hypothetical protein IKC13_03560 [Elusimicrobiaceae bacterium]|nr:hypothetical protein [Elusimicrobiaceae bacterium]